MRKVVRFEYILALLLCVGVFNSCSESLVNKPSSAGRSAEFAELRPQTAAGNYLAGRVAHLRQDLNRAADHYANAVDLGYEQPELLGRTYLLLAYEGRIEKAHRYAQKALEKGDKNYVIRFLNMAHYMSQGDYDAAEKSLSDVKEKVYKEAILPPFYAWTAVGKGDRAKALAALKPLLKDEQLQTMYYIHTGLINDYFGESEAASEAYRTVVENENIELSFRSLQIISNFYVRNGEKDKALELIKKYEEKNNGAVMLSGLLRQVEQSADPQKLIDTPQKGLAEALFNTGTAFRQYQNEIAQVFTILSLNLNPAHDVARVSLADLMENSGQPERACAEYVKIGGESPIYFMARLKAASIYMALDKYDEAQEQLKVLNRKFPADYQVLFNLGEVNRITDNQDKAIKYYQEALKVLPEGASSDWTILYAMGISYERNRQWDKAEDVLQQALTISKRHPLVLNYIGYSWLKNNKNPNEALYMIFEAYRLNPEDAYIMDSLGWALFKMGRYKESVKVLERAAEYLPDNAVICDHLGDAYWQTGRKNEAKYQWKHALTLKDDMKEVDPEVVRTKLGGGMEAPAVIPFNETLLVERLKLLGVAP